MKIKIEKHKLENSQLLYFNNPEIVYIPLISGNDTDITILVKKNEYVYKGSMIGKRKGDYRIPIFSSVSGTVIDFKEKTCFNGQKVKCVVIKNDFKEAVEHKSIIKEKINQFTQEEFIEILKDKGIIGLGGAGFPTYLKYDKSKAKTLLINAIECEPYVMADNELCKLKCEEILEAIDAILEINKIPQAIIAIKKTNVELKKIFDNYIGTYLKIKIKTVSDYYPAGWERNLVKDTLNITYNKYPIEQGIIVNNVSTIYAIYEALKYDKPLIERIITFSGDAVKGTNALVKIGTPINDILDKLEYDKDSIIVSGGPMMGAKADSDLVVSANQNSILIMKPKTSLKTECLKCGKCVEACPVKLSPVLIMNMLNNKDLIKMQPEKCIECGLCSYICPAHINVRNEIKKAKTVIKELK